MPSPGTSCSVTQSSKIWFDTTKEMVRKMGVRTVEINDPIEQTVFEVYAALELRTTREQGGFNDFENH